MQSRLIGARLRIKFGQPAAVKFYINVDRERELFPFRRMEINDRRFQSQRDVWMPLRHAFHIGKLTNRMSRFYRPGMEVVAKARERLVINVDAGQGVSVITLKRGERSPFVHA